MTAQPATAQRDHGGNLDAAIARFGGARADWLDLSTGINPVPYPLPPLAPESWAALPDRAAQDALIAAARAFWSVPEGAAVLAVPGASAAIAHIPLLAPAASVHVPGPTYNEHAAAFRRCGWQVTEDPAGTTARVLVHPNNPTGTLHPAPDAAGLSVIDESFCDIAPGASHVALANRPGTLILKSFGKFWGLAGLRLGFVIGDPALVAQLQDMLGPWPVAGPALQIGRAALRDPDWAAKTRARLAEDRARLDRALAPHARSLGGTDLFRLYECDDAAALQTRLARHRIWSRIFPYSTRWLRLGLPAPQDFPRLEDALS